MQAIRVYSAHLYDARGQRADERLQTAPIWSLGERGILAFCRLEAGMLEDEDRLEPDMTFAMRLHRIEGPDGEPAIAIDRLTVSGQPVAMLPDVAGADDGHEVWRRPVTDWLA